MIVRSRCLSTSIALALAALAPSCMLIDRPTKVTFSSDPPGARVVVDEKDSGFVTPCVLALETDDDVQVDLVYPGYMTARRTLTPEHHFEVIFWRDMYVRSGVWHFPLWLNTKDIFAPVKHRHPLIPGRVYVRLERAADST